jgi:hypothetical protein
MYRYSRLPHYPWQIWSNTISEDMSEIVHSTEPYMYDVAFTHIYPWESLSCKLGIVRY